MNIKKEYKRLHNKLFIKKEVLKHIELLRLKEFKRLLNKKGL